jgi:hypothetical protein
MSSDEKMKEKFILVCDDLKAKRLIKNESDLATFLELTPQTLYRVRSGTMRLTLNIIKGMYEQFQVNPSFFFDDFVPMYMAQKNYARAEDGSLIVLEADFEYQTPQSAESKHKMSDALHWQQKYLEVVDKYTKCLEHQAK